MNVGIAARNIAQKIPSLDENKAYILGILHDIGRRVGIVNIPKHVYEGYKFCLERGWDEAARICMTHSYVLMKEEFEYEPSTKEEIEIKKYIMNCNINDYDRLIQLCDSLATDLRKLWVAQYMMFYLISEERHYYLHQLGNHL